MSRKGLSDFELTELKLGYWNRPRDVARQIEIDLVALDEGNKIIRFGSCKRTARGYLCRDLRDYAALFGGKEEMQR